MKAINRRLAAVLTVFVLLLTTIGGLPQQLTANAAEVIYHGVDVSTYNGDIDWTLLAGNDIDFVIMRGGKLAKEGTEYYEDDRFDANYAAARRVGLRVGVYLYCGATTWESFEAAVNEFLVTIEGKEFGYPVFLDVESDAQTKLGKEVMTKYVLDGLAMIREAGFNAAVYANLNWFRNFLDGDAISAEGYPLWLARYTYDYTIQDYSDTYCMWQYSDKGDLNGNGSSAIDLDISYVNFNYFPEHFPEINEACEPFLPLRTHVWEEEYYTPYYADMETEISGASVFPTDECIIREIYTNGWCKFIYPTKMGNRIGFLPFSTFLPANPDTYTETITAEWYLPVYSRPDLAEEIGYIAKGDEIRIIQRDGEDKVMALYPVYGGWKIGWYQKKVWSAEDAAFVMDYLHGKRTMQSNEKRIYDIDENGIVNVFDLAYVKKWAASGKTIG